MAFLMGITRRSVLYRHQPQCLRNTRKSIPDKVTTTTTTANPVAAFLRHRTTACRRCRNRVSGHYTCWCPKDYVDTIYLENIDQSQSVRRSSSYSSALATELDSSPQSPGSGLLSSSSCSPSPSPSISSLTSEETQNHTHTATATSTTTTTSSTAGTNPLALIDPEFFRQVNTDPDDLFRFASQQPTTLRLSDLYTYGRSQDPLQRIRNAVFLHREMPIRIAHRAVDLLTLPHGLSDSAPIRQVAAIYCQYLQRFQDLPEPQTIEQEEAFTDMLKSLVLDRSSIPTAIANGVRMWRNAVIRTQLPESPSADDRIASAATEAPTNAVSETMDKQNDDDDNDDDDDDDDDDEYASTTGSNASTSAEFGSGGARQMMMRRRSKEMEDALHRFFTARVGLRFLTEHHVLSSRRSACQELRKVTHIFPAAADSTGNNTYEEEELGCIQSNCNLVEETRKVADFVKKQTEDYYDGLCPAIEIVDCQQQQTLHQDQQVKQPELPQQHDKESDPFTYATHHLHYMLAELLKNSCRATVHQYLKANTTRTASKHALSITLPRQPVLMHPIRIIITKGEEDVTIKIADRGGGIPRSRMNHIWKFGHSHHDDDEEFQAEFGTSEGVGARIRGFGLPLARVYARYFGGELTLRSMEGYGVDAYLHLPRLGTSCENLPMRVRASPGERDSTPGRRHSRRSRSLQRQ